MSGRENSCGRFVDGIYVSATALESNWQVGIDFGKESLCISRYVSASDARLIAAALIAAADHYDAETLRLAELAKDAA